MKHILTVLIIGFFTCIHLNLFSQTVKYGNEWIDINKDHYKIKIAEEGVYRIPQSVLANNGILADGADYKMYTNGEEVPLYVSSSGQLGGNDFIEFYADRLDGSFDTQLFAEPEMQLHNYISQFTDTAVYFLLVDPNANNLRLNQTNNDLTGAPAPRAYFIYEGLYVGNNSHFNGVGKRFSGVNVYFSEYEEGEGWYGNLFAANEPFAQNNIKIKVPTPNIYPAGPAADIELKVVGASDDFFTNNDHTLQVKLNGDEIVYEKFEGYTVRKYNVDNYALTKLSSPDTEFEMSALGFASRTDKQATSYISINYPRDFNFQGVNQLLFDLETNGTSTDLIEITDFPAGGAAPVMLDLLNNIRIEGIISGNKVSFHLPAASNNNRKLFIYQNTGSIVKQVNRLQQRNFIDFTLTSNQGDYVIISQTNLLKDGSVDEYAAYRASAEGGNHNTTIVDVELLYDQFAHGIRKHPLSIKNFLFYASEVWQNDIENLFLIGKSIKNSKCRTTPDNWQKNLVPTYGDAPSDMEFGILKDKILPTIAVGRLSSFIDSLGNSTHTQDYLNKVKEYESANVYTCNKRSLDWKKQVLHIAGGDDLQQQEMFNKSLNIRERIIEDTLYGGFVHRMYRGGGGPVVNAPIEIIRNLINNVGLGLICFYGHASGLLWEVNIGHARDYNNKGRYPFILANSCFVGDIHKSFADEKMLSMSEEWVLEPEKGAIGYLAGVQFGFPPSLDEYTESIYRQIAYNNYNGGIGKSMINTINEIHRDNNEGILITSEEMVLEGDPAVVVGYAPKPEFEVTNADIFFEPNLISTRLDSFRVNVVLSNYGTYNTADSITLCIERKYEDGTVVNIANPRFTVPAYQDTFGVNIYTDPLEGFGENEITVKVDCNNELEELCEENNIAVTQLFITADNLVPVNPCEFSIVNQPDITLQASTASPILAEQDYIFQMDTTEAFNSGLLNEQTLKGAGGIVEWQPGFNFSNPQWQGVVFYWRVAKVDSVNVWRNSSFIYDEDLSSGWNQSHFYQYNRGTSSRNMSLNEQSRQFEYAANVGNIKAQGQYVNSNEWMNVSVDLNNVREVTWSCLGEGSCTYDGGIQFVILNPANFSPWISEIDDVDMSRLEDENCFAGSLCCDRNAKGRYGNIHCRSQDTPAFDFETRTIADLQNIIAFLDDIPNGYYVLIKSIQNHKLDIASNPQVASYINTIHNKIESMGGAGIKSIQRELPFLFLLRKGISLDIFEPEIHIGTSISDVLKFDRNVESKWSEGTFESTLIGPADEWQSLFVKTYNRDPSFNQSDQYHLNVYGIRIDGREYLLSGTGDDAVLGELTFSGDELITSLSSVNAIFYPYIKLELVSEDQTNNTPPQLDYWRVNFEGVTELAFNTSKGIIYEGDTLFRDKPFDSTIPIDTIELGESFDLSVIIENVSDIDADSILLVYEVVDDENKVYSAGTSVQAPLLAGTDALASGSFSTNRLAGLNYLYVKLNPLEANPYYQREKFGFNNILILPFFIGGDNSNPLLDVTFDGVHILDGDLVAAQPEISVTVRDDNPFLALDDPDVADIILTYPDGTTESIEVGDSSVIFIPANPEDLEEDNVAQVIINRHFEQDGTYCIEVNAQDIAGNAAGEFAYKVSFEVKNESTVSHIYNYPNPFTTSTQFMFTLTGLQVPEVFKIQILTVGGKIVREIDKTELGNLHIGKNITEYRWDGKDEYGGVLGNGVYLYRIIASTEGEKTGYLSIYAENQNGKQLEDAYHKSGFGKLYIMR